MKRPGIALALGFDSGASMISSSQSVGASAFAQLRSNIQQSIQDWIRREIIDDDPYDVLAREEPPEILS